MEHYLSQASQLYQEQRYEDALAIYDQAIRLNNSNPDPRLLLGKAEVLKRLAEQAFEQAKQLGYDENRQQQLSLTSDVPLEKMNLKILVAYAEQELQKYRHRELATDQYCLELVRRAIVLRENDAWVVLQQQLSGNIRLWINRHPQREAMLRLGNEQSYVDDVFARFLGTVTKQSISFSSFSAMMKYLHLCLNASIMDTLRAHSRLSQEVTSAIEETTEQRVQEDTLFNFIESLLPGQKERRVAYLIYYCNLKPREIIRYCPNEFSGESEIYRLKRTIIECVVRNAKVLREKSGEQA